MIKMKRPKMDENLLRILKKIYGDDIKYDKEAGNVVKDNKIMATGLIQNIYSNAVPYHECRAEAMESTKEKEDMLFMVFYYDYKKVEGFFGGVSGIFRGIAQNKKIQLPKEVKTLFSDTAKVENRLKKIMKAGYGDAWKKIDEDNYKRAAGIINYTFLQNKFQEKTEC